MLFCINCAQEIHGYQNKKFCSRTCQKQCQRSLNSDAISHKRVCLGCLEAFSPQNKKRLTCSNACRQNFHRYDYTIPLQILSAGGNRIFSEIGFNYGFLHGAQLPRKSTEYYYPYFADQDWKNPDLDEYVKALKKYRPRVATILDWEFSNQLDTVLYWAKTISTLIPKIIIVPKVVGEVHRLPKRINGQEIILGYSIRTSHGGTLVPIEEFYGWPVHLLGGSHEKQIDIWKKNRNFLSLVSCDGNYMFGQARRNQFFSEYIIPEAKNERWPQHNETKNGYKGNNACYEAVRLTCQNVRNAWKKLSLATKPELFRRATLSDVNSIKEISDKNKNSLSFIPKGAFQESLTRCGDTLMFHPAGAFARWHARLDGQTTVYEICVDEPIRGMNLGKTIIEMIPKPFFLKCPIDNVSNQFYNSVGLILKKEIPGKYRNLNIWISPP